MDKKDKGELDATKYKFSVQVIPQFLEASSHLLQSRYVFAYLVVIQNKGTVSASLKERRWFITDSKNNQQEVKGEGVVGKQPLLHPGEMFHYVSGTVLETSYGVMQGEYRILAQDGTSFIAPIKPFVLSIPRTIH